MLLINYSALRDRNASSCNLNAITQQVLKIHIDFHERHDIRKKDSFFQSIGGSSSSFSKESLIRRCDVVFLVLEIEINGRYMLVWDGSTGGEYQQLKSTHIALSDHESSTSVSSSTNPLGTPINTSSVFSHYHITSVNSIKASLNAAKVYSDTVDASSLYDADFRARILRAAALSTPHLLADNTSDINAHANENAIGTKDDNVSLWLPGATVAIGAVGMEQQAYFRNELKPVGFKIAIMIYVSFYSFF